MRLDVSRLRTSTTLAQRLLRAVAEKDSGMNDNNPTSTQTDTHKPARPLRFVKDRQGNGWLCDRNVDPDGDLQAQGCWRCGDMAFPMGGR